MVDLDIYFPSFLSIKMSYFFGGGEAEPTPAPIPYIPISRKPICSVVSSAENGKIGLTEDQIERLGRKTDLLRSQLSSPLEEWEAFLEVNGVKGVRKFIEGKDVGIIRSEVVMPFNILDIFEFLTNLKNAPTLDPMVETTKIIKVLSNHTWGGVLTLFGVSRSFAVFSFLFLLLYSIRHFSVLFDLAVFWFFCFVFAFLAHNFALISLFSL